MPGARGSKGKDSPLRAKIVSAATRLFESVGYHAASVEKIARQAGVAKGSVYWHFRSKEDLLVAMVAEEIAKFREKVFKRLAAEPRELSARLEAVLDLGDWIRARGDRLSRVVVEAIGRAGSPKASSMLRRKLINLVRGSVRETRDALANVFRKIRPPAGLTPELAAVCLLGCLQGLLHQYFIDPKAFKVKEAKNALLRLFFKIRGGNK